MTTPYPNSKWLYSVVNRLSSPEVFPWIESLLYSQSSAISLKVHSLYIFNLINKVLLYLIELFWFIILWWSDDETQIPDLHLYHSFSLCTAITWFVNMYTLRLLIDNIYSIVAIAIYYLYLILDPSNPFVISRVEC